MRNITSDDQLNKDKHLYYFLIRIIKELLELIQMKANFQPFGLTAIFELLNMVLSLKAQTSVKDSW